jgi:hypothetical protein
MSVEKADSPSRCALGADMRSSVCRRLADNRANITQRFELRVQGLAQRQLVVGFDEHGTPAIEKDLRRSCSEIQARAWLDRCTRDAAAGRGDDCEGAHHHPFVLMLGM